jgi:hypothetical protein
MNRENDGLVRAFAYNIANLRDNQGLVQHGAARLANEAWQDVGTVDAHLIDQEIDAARKFFFSASSTGRRYLYELNDLIRSADQDLYIAQRLNHFFSRGPYLEGEPYLALP